MAAMATIVKPLGGANPVAKGSLIPTRTTSPGNCKRGWVRASRRGCQLRFVVRASDAVGQTPMSSVQSGTESETGNSATELTTPSPLQNGGSMDETEVGATPSSSNESATESEAGNLAAELKTPSPFQNGGSMDETEVGATPSSSNESATESEAGNLAAELKTPSPFQNGGSMDETEVGATPLSPNESATDEAPKLRKPSPLQKGGTLDGDDAAGKDPAATTLGKKAPSVSNGAGKFDDPRWRAGTWDITKFTRDGKIDWDAVIDAEVMRRKWLEENPEASNDSEPVVFDTATVPWWAWVKRFHLPEAELLNGRAAMVGYGVGYLVDSATGAGLVDQQNSFLGKLLLFITVLGVLLIRKNSDVQNLRTIAKESTFYDKQWQATWKDEDSDDKGNSSSP